MPKSNKRLTINLNLLKPQSNPEKLAIKIFRWLLASGRYIFVLVEAVVLIAFAARFKLDADLQSKKEAIEEQIPYIESLKAYDILIRQTQAKLTTIDNVKTNAVDFSIVLRKISSQIPLSVKISAINITRNINTATIHLTGQTPVNNDLSSFISGLKQDDSFSNVDLANVGLEQGVIKFTIDLSARSGTREEKSL